MVRESIYSLAMRKSLLALLLFAAALPLRAQEAVHVMQPKQTLSAVSRLYGVPVKTLISLNRIANPDKIKVGTELRLPAGVKSVSRSSTDLAVRSNTSDRPKACLLYTSPSPRDRTRSRMPSSA